MDYGLTNIVPPTSMGGFSHQMMALSIRPKDPSKIADLEPAAAHATMSLSMRPRVQPRQSIFGGSEQFESVSSQIMSRKKPIPLSCSSETPDQIEARIISHSI